MSAISDGLLGAIAGGASSAARGFERDAEMERFLKRQQSLLGVKNRYANKEALKQRESLIRSLTEDQITTLSEMGYTVDRMGVMPLDQLQSLVGDVRTAQLEDITELTPQEKGRRTAEEEAATASAREELGLPKPLEDMSAAERGRHEAEREASKRRTLIENNMRVEDEDDPRMLRAFEQGLKVVKGLGVDVPIEGELPQAQINREAGEIVRTVTRANPEMKINEITNKFSEYVGRFSNPARAFERDQNGFLIEGFELYDSSREKLLKEGIELGSRGKSLSDRTAEASDEDKVNRDQTPPPRNRAGLLGGAMSSVQEDSTPEENFSRKIESLVESGVRSPDRELISLANSIMEEDPEMARNFTSARDMAEYYLQRESGNQDIRETRGSIFDVVPGQ